jgi:methylenetetrahydrofolate reductase (NADPH)
MAGCVANGAATKAAILPTIILTKTAGALRFMESSVPGIHVPQPVIDRVAQAHDPAEESYQLVREQVAHALSLPGVAGIHITDFRHDDSLQRLVGELQIGPAFAGTSAQSA